MNPGVHTVRGLAAVVVACLLSTTTVLAASADPVITSDGDYCAAWAPTGKIACVADARDFPQAKAAVVPGETAGGSISSGAQASYAWVTVFDNINLDASAGYLTFYGPADCTSSRTNLDGQWSDTTTWRSRISSFDALSNCYARGFYNTGSSGTSTGGYVGSTNYVGSSLNDHVWSMAFS